MKHFNLIGGGFQHAYSSTEWKKPKNLVWDYESKDNPVSVYCDSGIIRGIEDKNDGKKKYAWVLESRFISQPYVDHIKDNLDQYLETYELFFVHHKELLDLHDKFVWCPAYGTYIKDIKIYPKTKTCSMISSGKNSTSLHQLRCQIIERLKDNPSVDIFGRDINPIEDKEEGLCNYRFSIAIENDSYETYYTEKLLDCFATGTVPIYIGPPDIGDHYDEKGIIPLSGTFDFSALTEDLYQSKMEHIKNNIEKTLELDVLDDWIYNTYLK
jgi:hypothetical protein